jgi:hypothetical protein
MPRLVPALAAPYTPPTTPPTPTYPVPVDPGTLVAEWIEADDTIWPLTTKALGWWTMDDVTGWGAVPIEIVTQPNPRGGVRIQHTAELERYILWTLRTRAATHQMQVEVWRRIVNAFTRTRRIGPGTLRIYRPDGTAREILASYKSGFAGQPGQGYTYDTAALTLLCEDPYFRDIADQPPLVREYVATSADYQDPYPSVSAANSIDGEFEIFNAGDAPAFPVWTITGPMTSIAATNLTTGEEFTLTTTLADNTEQVVIDTSEPSVIGPDGLTRFGQLSQPESELWGLEPGTNLVEFVIGGANSGTTVSLTWRNRWETA